MTHPLIETVARALFPWGNEGWDSPIFEDERRFAELHARMAIRAIQASGTHRIVPQPVAEACVLWAACPDSGGYESDDGSGAALENCWERIKGDVEDWLGVTLDGRDMTEREALAMLSAAPRIGDTE